MKIQDMFEKSIDREINGVIMVGQKEKENVYQELNEYVVTDEIDRYMNKFFDAYEKGLTGKTSKMGVWISGFFGSGKSHFLKILSYILSDKKVRNTDDPSDSRIYSASDFFMDDVKVPDKKLQEKIKDVASYADDTDVILFNVDSKSTAENKDDKEAIKKVFMKVFNDYLGYCGSIPFLAAFERSLDEKGKYDEFKEKFKEISGDDWVDARDDFYFSQDDIVEAVSEIGVMSKEAAENWANNAESTYSFSIEDFANYVKSYCDSKGSNHHVVFLVDEIGQYIADDSKLMVNLQTVTEDLGIACQGKAWIAVTSQQDIDSITKIIGDDFSKIQGRFDTRVSLSSADVAEVVQKRLLQKKPEVSDRLKPIYERYKNTIENNITFSEGTPHMPLYADAQNFADVYPFVPYQFKLLGEVLTAIRQYSSSGKNTSDGERSMLAYTQIAARKYEDQDSDILIPFDAFYDRADDDVDHQHRVVISEAMKNPRLNDFDVRLLKVLFMIKHVRNFQGTTQNLTTLMISRLDQDMPELHKTVEESLRRLCDELLVQRNGDLYVFLTNEEQEAENRIRNINVDTKVTQQYIAATAFEEIIAFPNSKYRYSNRYSFSFNTELDDRIYKNNSSDISLHLYTAFSGDLNDQALSMLSMNEQAVIVKLDDTLPYISEVEMMEKIQSFLESPENSTLTDFEIIKATKQKERLDFSKRAREYIREALENSTIFVRGAKLNIKTKKVQERIGEGFRKLIDSVYSKLKNMKSEPTQETIREVLKKNNNYVQVSFGGVDKDPDEEALNDLLSAVQFNSNQGIRTSLKQLLDQFGKAPYGYTEEDIEYLVAVHYKRGHISFRLNSVIHTPASTSADEAYKYLTQRGYRETLLIELKQTPKKAWVKSVKEVIHDFFGHAAITDDSDALMRDFKTYCETFHSRIEKTLASDYIGDSPLPGKETLEKALRMIDEVNAIQDPMTFYQRVNELEDDFKAVALDMADLKNFLEGTQKDKFLNAYKALKIYEASKNYISDQEIIDYANQIRKIIKNNKPYSFIKKLEQYDQELTSSIMDLLQKYEEAIKPQVYDDFKTALDAVVADRPYTDRLKESFSEKFNELLEKLSHTSDIASMNGIPTESTALLEKCLRENDAAEAAYQASIIPPKPPTGGGIDPQPPKPPVHKPPKTVTMRMLTHNKTYRIKTKDDVERFLDEMRKSLMEQLDDDTTINLS